MVSLIVKIVGAAILIAALIDVFIVQRNSEKKMYEEEEREGLGITGPGTEGRSRFHRCDFDYCCYNRNSCCIDRKSVV